MTRRSNDNHVCLGPQGKCLQCMHCGYVQPLNMPVEIGYLADLTKLFVKHHRGCKAPLQPRCWACMELGHDLEQHVALKVHHPEQWPDCGDTGLSSMAIWQHMMGRPVQVEVPHDPDDFGRCYRLLAKFPAWRARIEEMACYPAWAPLVEVWAELETLYRVERPKGTAPTLYRRMKKLLGEEA